MAVTQAHVRTKSSDARPLGIPASSPDRVSSTATSTTPTTVSPSSTRVVSGLSIPGAGEWAAFSALDAFSPQSVPRTATSPAVEATSNTWRALYEARLVETLNELTITDCPPRLAATMHAALLPGGARLRPKLTVSVAAAA